QEPREEPRLVGERQRGLLKPGRGRRQRAAPDEVVGVRERGVAVAPGDGRVELGGRLGGGGRRAHEGERIRRAREGARGPAERLQRGEGRATEASRRPPPRRRPRRTSTTGNSSRGRPWPSSR